MFLREHMKDLGTWLPLVGVALAWLALTRLGKVSSKRAHQLVEAGAQLIDVRSESEFASAHVPGATNIPLDRLAGQAGRLAGEGRPLVVYCASGVRSAMAKRALRRAGAEVYDLGTMRRW
jgi:rhodanese-related sulfurtransferase